MRSSLRGANQLAALAVRHAVPTIYSSRGFAATGGLMSCAGSQTESYHQAGVYTGRILKARSQPTLPVQQVTKIELTVNLKTARRSASTFPRRFFPWPTS
jgi:putative tryptophan/tyrosine transport system substrate-binding protein